MAIELLTPRVSAVRRVAGVRRGEPRFAEPSWVAGVVRFGSLIAINANKKQVILAIELLTPRVNAVRRVAGVRRGEPRFAEPTWVVGEAHFSNDRESSEI